MFDRKLALVVTLALAACGRAGDRGPADGGSNADMTTGSVLIGKSPYTLAGQITTGKLLIGYDVNYAVYTIDPMTGEAKSIAPKADGGVSVVGDVVFISHDIDTSTYNGELAVWTPTSGYHDLGVSESAAYYAWSDGQHILYQANINVMTGTADLLLDTIDHAGAKTLFTQELCSYTPVFDAGKVVVGHGTGTATTGAVTAYDLTSGAGTDLAASASIYFTPDTQNNALIVSGTNGSTLFDFASGDEIAMPTDFSSGVFSADGKSIYAVTNPGGIEVVDWSGSTATAKTPVLSGGAEGLFGGSPDGKYALYYSAYDMTTFTTDLQLVALGSASTAVVLAQTGVSYPQFSNDSAFIAFGSNISQTTYVGPLMVAPVSTGKAVQVAAAAAAWWFVNDDELLVLDNLTTVGENYVGDVELVNLKDASMTSQKILSQVSTGIIVPTDGKSFYYSAVSGQASLGVYRYFLP